MNDNEEIDFSKLKPVPPEILEKIRAAAAAGRFEMAPTKKIDAYSAEVDTVLEAIGNPEALVTDESTIHDFMMEEKEIKDAEAKLGLKLMPDDYIFALAMKLAKTNRKNSNIFCRMANAIKKLFTT